MKFRDILNESNSNYEISKKSVKLDDNYIRYAPCPICGKRANLSPFRMHSPNFFQCTVHKEHYGEFEFSK